MVEILIFVPTLNLICFIIWEFYADIEMSMEPLKFYFFKCFYNVKEVSLSKPPWSPRSSLKFRKHRNDLLRINPSFLCFTTNRAVATWVLQKKILSKLMKPIIPRWCMSMSIYIFFLHTLLYSYTLYIWTIWAPLRFFVIFSGKTDSYYICIIFLHKVLFYASIIAK